MTKGQELMAVKEGTVDRVSEKIKSLEQRGEIQFPPNYSPQNALRSAWLILQETKDKDKKPVLKTCSQVSIMNSLFDMVVQGLNPAKKQCYFLAYGSQLTCQRSYFGTMAVAKMVDPTIGDIHAEVVWEGDEFEFEIVKGQKQIIQHKQTLKSIDSKKPAGAYCQILDHDGNVRCTEVMTWEQIKSAWKKSPQKPFTDKGNLREGTVHNEFMQEMIKRTVIGRACKPIINSSNDGNLRLAANRTEFVQTEHKTEEKELEEANQTPIDVLAEADEGEVVDTGEPEAEEPISEEEAKEIEEKENQEASGPENW